MDGRITGYTKGLVTAGKFVLTERIITVITRVFTDVLMIRFIITDPEWGWVWSLVVVTPIYILVCMIIVAVSDYYQLRGIDITGIEEMRKILDSDLQKKQIFKRFVRWFMRRRITIFLVGSCVYLDPDYVTLMLRRAEDSFLKTIFRITIPSVAVSMVFWTTIYWLAYQPMKDTEWARWVVENL